MLVRRPLHILYRSPLYEIIRNPGIEAKLLNEINELLGEQNDIKFEDLAKLKYLGQVLEEGLRRHPVAPAPARFLSKDITVGGYHIPKGTGMNSQQFFFSMNPKIWKDPEALIQKRFFLNRKHAKILPQPTFHFPLALVIVLDRLLQNSSPKFILAKLLRKFQF